MLTRLLSLLCCSLLTSCASVLPPTQAMSDARQAIQIAREQRAENYALTNLSYAERYLLRAEKSLSIGPHAYREARYYALNAKDEALFAREISLQIQMLKQHLKKHHCLSQTAKILWLQLQKQARLGDALKVQQLSKKLLPYLDENPESIDHP